MTWWGHSSWLGYEDACGQEIGERQDLLADADWRTRIVRAGEMKLRKSYRPIVRRVLAEYECPFLSGADETWAIEVARGIHYEAAGRETRPRESWDAMAGWMEDGFYHVALALDETKKPVAFAGFITYQDWAYYGHAASLVRDVGLGLIAGSVVALPRFGVEWIELGWQGEATDKKGKNIEFVRTGYGGRDVPVLWSGRSLTEAEWESCAE